jgi:hypothetical protein
MPGRYLISVPEDAALIHAAVQEPFNISIWFNFDPDKCKPLMDRKIMVVATGQKYEGNGAYLGAVFDAAMVWHIFEVF